MMSFLSRLFRRLPPDEQLVADVLDELKRRGVAVKGYDHDEYAVLLGDGKLGLRNLFLQWRLHDRHEQKRLLTQFLDGQLAREETPDSFDSVADRVMPLVRSRHDVSCSLLQAQIAGAPVGNSSENAWVPIAGDVVVTLGIDRDASIVRLTRVSLQRFGVPFEDALRRALQNLAAKPLPRLAFVESAPGVYASSSWSDYQSSLMLAPELIPPLPAGSGDLIALFAGRNDVFVAGSNNEAALLTLLDIAEKSIEGLHHPCSTMLFRRDGTHWNVFEPEPGTALHQKHHRVSLKQEAANYTQQKHLLDKLHSARNEDIFVANLAVFFKGEHYRSHATWASLAITLLPRAEHIIFVEQIGDPATGLVVGTKGIVEVEWERAMPIVRHLMQEVPDLYPPRYLVRSFPDEATLLKLEKIGARFKPDDSK